MLNNFYQTAMPLLTVSGATTLIFFGVLTTLRVVGYRIMGRMSTFDFITIIGAGVVLQMALTDFGITLTVTGALAGMVTLVMLNVIVCRIPFLTRLFIKCRVKLIENGKLLATALENEGITQDHLMITLRSEGFASAHEVQEAYLETTGKVTIIPIPPNPANLDPVSGLQQYWMTQGHVDFLKESGCEVSAMLLDIDGMAKINEDFGLEVGNTVIRMVGGIIQGMIRPNDRIYRFTEDRFVMAVPVDAENAAKLAERIRCKLDASPLFIDHHDITAKVTIGVADINPGEHVSEILEKLQAGVADGKLNGGDCIITCKDNEFVHTIVMSA